MSRTLIVATIAGLLICGTFQSATAQQNRKRKRPRRANALKGAKQETYKKVGDVELKMHVFYPRGHRPGDKRAAIVFFFGGGWRSGSPTQFGRHCQYLASRGMVAMAADYRVESRHKVKVVQCIADAKSAIRWVRANASRLGVDPQRIASAGGSAGGHLAAAVGTLDGFEEPGANLKISSRPNAMLLFNPALNLTPEGFHAQPDSRKMKERLRRFGAEPRKISPTFHVSKSTPPAIIFHGKDDPTVPFSQAVEFAKAMRKHGVACEVDGYEGEKHGFFNFGRGGNKAFVATLKNADRFLTAHHFLNGSENVDAFFKPAGKR